MRRSECLGDTLGKMSWINPKRFEGSLIGIRREAVVMKEGRCTGGAYSCGVADASFWGVGASDCNEVRF